MQRLNIRAIAAGGIFLCLFGIVATQVTLSKGWGPGKRSVYDEACMLTTKSTISICHTLVSEIRRLIACETRRTLASGQGMDESIPWLQKLFTDERYS